MKISPAQEKVLRALLTGARITQYKGRLVIFGGDVDGHRRVRLGTWLGLVKRGWIKRNAPRGPDPYWIITARGRAVIEEIDGRLS